MRAGAARGRIYRLTGCRRSSRVRRSSPCRRSTMRRRPRLTRADARRRSAKRRSARSRRRASTRRRAMRRSGWRALIPPPSRRPCPSCLRKDAPSSQATSNNPLQPGQRSVGGDPVSGTRRRQFGQTACEVAAAGTPRAALRGSRTTVHCVGGAKLNRSRDRSRDSGCRPTSRTASWAPSRSTRYQAPRRRRDFTSSRNRAHFSSAILTLSEPRVPTVQPTESNMPRTLWTASRWYGPRRLREKRCYEEAQAHYAQSERREPDRLTPR